MLNPALATAPARSWFDIAAVVGAGALAGIALGLAARSVPAPEVAPAAPAPPAPAIVEALPQATLAPAPDPDAPADPGASPLLFVFRAGGATYVKLADIQDSDDHGDAMAMPPHAAPRLSRDRDGVVAAVAAVAADDVPDALRAWGDDRHVEVDEVCLATITGFAVVSRLVGDPGYAGVAKWTAAGVLRSGHAVLAARLDRCVGSFARDAAQPAFAVPLHHHDAALETAARDALLA
ncbi:MAG TPA: hypothetical protein VK607_03590, partial [Kofleriaceae bacterium]|nr:hypothetical protein [Kofleriaceae bacterium]